jgi:hypothetical protein
MSSFGEVVKKTAIPFNYDVDDKNNTSKAPKFDGNVSYPNFAP